MLIVYILIFIVVFIYLLFIKNRYQSFDLGEIKDIVGNKEGVLLTKIEKDAKSTTYKDFNTKIKLIYDKVFGFLDA
jgi:hypothetical protein